MAKKKSTYKVNGKNVTISDSERRAAEQDIASNGFYSATHRMDEEKIRRDAERIEQEDREYALEKIRQDPTSPARNAGITGMNSAARVRREQQRQEEARRKRQEQYNNNPYAQVMRMTMLNQERARLDSLPGMTLDEVRDYDARSAALERALRETNKNLDNYNTRRGLERVQQNARQDSEFAKYAQRGNAIENPSYEKAQSGLYIFGKQVGGAKIPNKVTFARDNADKLAEHETAIVNGTEKQRALYRHMTNDEVETYNYLLAKDNENGTHDADDYLGKLTETLRDRQSAAINDYYVQTANEHPVLATATNIIGSPLKGTAMASAALDRIRGREIDRNSGAMQFARGMDTMTSTVSGNINEDVYKKTDSAFLANASSFVYDTGVSIAQSAFNTLASGGNAIASSLMMSGSAGASAMQEALDGGATDDQALAVGGWAALFEALFEKVSIENFVKMSSPAAKGAVVKNILKQMGIEASEESATEIADIISESWIMGENSQYRDKSAAELAFQVFMSGLGGAVSGGVMGSFGQASNYLGARSIGRAAQQLNLQDQILADAAASSDKSASDLAKAMQRGTAKSSASNLGRVYASLAENGEYSNYDTEVILRAAAEEAAAEKQQKKSGKTAQRLTASQNAQNAPEGVSSQEQTNRTNTEENAQQTRKQPRVDYATNVVDNEETDITGIHSVEDGTVYVQAGDNVVALNDVEFANADIGELYERAGKYGTEAAQRFVKAYDGGSVEQYAKGFDAMYRAARDGVAYNAALQQSLYVENYLSEDQRMQAYAAGQSTSAQNQTQVATNQEQVATEQQVKKPQNTEAPAAVQTEAKAARQVKKAAKPGLTRSYVRAELTNEQRSAIKKNRSQLQVVDAMAKKYGREVVLVGSLQGMEINGQTVEQSVNGVYDPSSGRIYIAADAQDGAFAYVAMHELAHSVRAASESDYNALQTTVFDALTKNGQNVDDLVKYQMDTFGYAEDVAREEVVANSAATVLTDEEFVRNLYNNEHSLFEKIRKFFKELAETFKQLTQSASWSQDAALTPENVRAIAEVFDRVATDTAAAPPVGGSDGDVKYSIKSFARAAGIEADRDQETGKVTFRLDGHIVEHITVDHVKNHSALGALIRTALDSKYISEEDANIQYQAIADSMNMVMESQDPELVWAFEGATLFSAVKSNTDPQYGTTVDFTTVCRKTQEMIDAMSETMLRLGRGLSRDEITQLQNDIISSGGTVPCPVCYVFSRWAGIGGILDGMKRFQNKYDGYSREELLEAARNIKRNSKGKQLVERLRSEDTEFDTLISEREQLQLEKKQLTQERESAAKVKDKEALKRISERRTEIMTRNREITARVNEIKKASTPELAWLTTVRLADDYEQHGKVPDRVLFNLADAATFATKYPLAWKYRTNRGPSAGKAILPYSDMRLGDMIMGANSTVSERNATFGEVGGELTEKQKIAIDKARMRTMAQNLIGGQRLQSTSDFRYDYALDYFQLFFEMQALGSNAQTYTKIVEFADMIASVGGDVNLSVMPKNKGWRVGDDGKKHLEFSSVTGVDYEGAKRVSETYDNAQLILVGINDEHIMLALDEAPGSEGRTIGFVIPYHASGASVNEFISKLVSNLGEEFKVKFYRDYTNAQNDTALPHITPEQKRLSELRINLLTGTRKTDIGGGKTSRRSWAPTEDDIAFINRKNADISGRTFEDLREVELRALSGDKAAIAEYTSWSAGVLKSIYDKLWNGDGEYNGVRLSSAQAEHIMPHEYWNKTVRRENAYINGFIFRSYCYSLGLKPRFSGATEGGETFGDFTSSPGYWKTLIDRPMYTNDGAYRDQQKINVTGFESGMLLPQYGEEHWGEYKVQEPSREHSHRAAETFVAREKSSGELKLSVKDVEPADAKKLQRENDKLKGALENARAQLRLTDGMQVDEKAVTKLARGIVTDYSSKADVAKLSNDLYQLFNYASHSPDTDAAFSELNDIGIGVARQVIEQSQQVDTSVSEQFSDLKDYLKSTPIRLTDAQKEQITASYGSLANFRKEYRGTIRISNDGVALDTVIGEMSEAFPFIYDSIQSGDLIETLTNAADVTKPQIVNPYYMDMDGAAADLWLEIQQRYTDTPMVQTYADKQKAKLVELKQQQKQQIKELRQQAKDEMDVALQIAKERAQRQQDAAVRGERQKQQVKAEKLKAKNQQLRTDIENERIANAVNRALASKRYAALKEQRTADLKTQRETIKTRERVGRYKDRIKAAAMTLSAWNTSPSDKRFVPEGLRRAVSDFVSAIDMGFKEGSKVSENWKARMRQMQIAVENAQRSSPDVGMATWDQETVDNLASLTALIEGNDNIKSLRDLSEPQLKALADVLNGIKHEVINANKMFVNGRRESLSKAADSDIARMGSRKTGKLREQLQKIMDSKLILGNTKPIFLMDSLGGEYERIGRDLFDGQTEAAFILRDSKDFHSGLKKRYHVDKWLDQKGDVLTLNTEFGDTIRLSRGQALDVYEMYQREQQDTHTRHLADGGIVFKTDADGKRVDDTTAHPISDADIQKITSWLTDEQIAYADALVRYMSTTLAEAGNKTSLTLSGYKKYTGQHYVPFNSASDYIAHGAGQADGQQTPRLKNWGHGKSINAFANNPVVVESIDQIFGHHAEEMAMYAGLAIPQDNMIRYLNYKQPNEQGKRQTSMKSALRAAYGDNVVRYIDRFNADVGGKITADVRDQEMGPMLSRFKKGAVLASMSVVVQQPTAYFRAFSMLSVKNLLSLTKHPFQAYREAQQYAGTAVIKDIGGFDMQTSRGAADWILDKKPTNLIGMSDEFFGMFPEGADAFTWGQLWNVVKHEVHSKTGLAMNSEALLKAAGKRFDEVINYTQVYDSTFSRSDWMRSKSKFGSMVTAFMAEPTTSMNMFMYSLLHIKDKNYSGKVHFIPATLALAATTIINAAIKSVVYAARDDDDYATFWEKYLAQLKSALFGDKIEGLPDWLGTPLGFVAGSDFSVFTQIPLVSDVMELAQGYDVTRTDMNVVGDVVDAALGLFNEKKTVYTKVKNLIGAVGNLTGLPVKNLWRDVESVVRLFGVEIPAATGGTADGYAKLYETIASGDDKRAEKLRDTLEGKGKSSKDIDTGVAKSLMENDERIRQAYEMKDEGDIAGLEELRAELAETYGEEVVDKAIKLYENSLNSELKKEAEALLESESRIAELYDYSEKGETPNTAKEEALREQLEEQYGKELVEKALSVYAEQFAELDSALYTADDMELVGTLAFESGKTADLKTVVAEMEKDSKATDPKKSVLDKAVTAFKPLYTEALDKGYAQKAARIKKVLLDVYGSYGMTEEKIDKWLPGEKAAALYEAVDAGASVQSLNKLIKDAKAAGQKDSNIINRISGTYKEKMLEAWQKGDTRTYNQIASLLKNLNLYDNKGKLYYTDERFKDWQMAEKYDDLPEAVRAGDAGAVKQYVASLKKDGYSDGQITQRVSTNVHDELVEAYLKGDMSTYNKLKSMLQSLDLHDKRGNQYYPDSKIAKWIKDAQEKK